MIAGGIVGGGGGGGGRGGKSGGSKGGLSEQPDSLKSTSYAQVLDLVCEGEIEGLVNGLRSIYLDDTPVQNPDGSYNFASVVYSTVNGTQTQSAISGHDQVRNEIIVGLEVRASDGPVVKSISNLNVSSVAVTVQIPTATKMSNDGNLGGTSVNYAIDVNNNGGGWAERVNDVVSGKSSGAYERQYRVALPAGGPWQIRLRRITADSTSAQVSNKTYFKSYTEIIDARLRYPNSALVALRVEASQFRSMPRRGYDMKLLKIKYPTNATVNEDGSLNYSGTWNGSFQIGWCADPAWAYYDLLTTDRYGLGSYIDASHVDKWALYGISKHCNELVPDGFGGMEPRFTCNVWINTRQEAYKLLNDFTSVFRGMAYWNTGSVTAVQDAPSDPVCLFTNANVIDGQFSYQGSSAKVRHTVALVAWNNPEDMFRQHIEYVEDTDGIARYGVVDTEVVAFACSSRGQANRVGRWLLYTERYETEIVGFKTGDEGTYCRPGNIIKIADQYRAGQRLGGRISSATSNSITVDNLDSVPSGSLTLYVVGADGVVQSRAVTSANGGLITVNVPFSPVPEPQLGWVLSSSVISAQTFRVLTVNENDSGEYEITALAHNPSKYGYIENSLSLEPRNISNLSPVPAKVSSVSFVESLYRYQNDVRSKITVSWPAAVGATRYRLEWRYSNGNWQSDETSAFDYEILDTTATVYEVRIYSIGVFGNMSGSPTSGVFTALGKTTPPANVVGFTYSIDSLIGVTLKWNSVADIDLDQYEIRQGSTWGAGSVVARVKSNTYVLGAISGNAQTYWVKAIDTSGIYSAVAASVTTTFPPPGATTITAQVIDSNVLLRWAAVISTLAVDYYEIRKGPSWATGVPVGRAASSTFTTLFESASGTYTYWVAATDIGGNTGLPAAVSTSVSQPPDYVLMLSVDSTFSGVKSNAVVHGGVLYLGVDGSASYQGHFTNNAWGSPQQQVDAGYPYWVEPTATSAYYEEVVDYGAVIPSCKVSVTPTISTPIGSATLTWMLSVSKTSASGPWVDFVNTTEAYAIDFRWVKVRLNVSTVGGDDLVQVGSLHIKLDAKQKGDAGTVSCSAADPGGTTVTFNTAFTDVAAITLTPLGTSARYAIYDFVDAPNPTNFKILLYDNAGDRVNGTVSWTARGY